MKKVKLDDRQVRQLEEYRGLMIASHKIIAKENAVEGIYTNYDLDKLVDSAIGEALFEKRKEVQDLHKIFGEEESACGILQ